MNFFASLFYLFHYIFKILYQKFPYGMKSMKSDTIKSGRLLLVKYGINLIIHSQLKSLCQEFIIFYHSALFWSNET